MTLLRLACLLLPLSLLGACAQLPVEELRHDPGVDFAGLSSYAWVQRARPPELLGEWLRDPDLSRDVRRATDEALRERGVQPASRSRADLHVALHLSTERELRPNDPFFEIAATEHYDVGHLILEFVQASTGEVVWRGRSRADVQFVGSTIGLHDPRFVARDDPAAWPVDDLVEALLRAAPVGRR